MLPHCQKRRRETSATFLSHLSLTLVTHVPGGARTKRHVRGVHTHLCSQTGPDPPPGGPLGPGRACGAGYEHLCLSLQEATEQRGNPTNEGFAVQCYPCPGRWNWGSMSMCTPLRFKKGGGRKQGVPLQEMDKNQRVKQKAHHCSQREQWMQKPRGVRDPHYSAIHFPTT